MTAARRILVISHACSRAVNRAPWRALARRGWDLGLVTVDGLAEDGSFRPSDPAAEDDPPTWFLPLTQRNARRYRFQGLDAVLRDFRPDWVVLDNDPHSRLAVDLARQKRAAGFRLAFLSCENLPFHPLALWRRRGLRGALLGLYLGWCRWQVRAATDLLFVINQAGLALFRAAGYRRVVKTPLGFPEAQFQVLPAVRERRRAALGLDGPVVGYFGRLTPEKGVHLLLEALAGLSTLRWTLLLDRFQAVSDYQAALQQRLQADPAFRGRVRWVEAAHGEVAEVMNATDMVVLPSLSTSRWVEQYGRVAPEAMACGCLVIAASSGALPELVGDAGWLFPEGDVQALQTLLGRALAAPEATAELRRHAAQRAWAHYSASAQAALWDAELGAAPG